MKRVSFRTMHDYPHFQEVEMKIPSGHKFNLEEDTDMIRRFYFLDLDSWIGNWNVVYERGSVGDSKVITKYRNRIKTLRIYKGEKLIDVLRKDYRKLSN